MSTIYSNECREYGHLVCQCCGCCVDCDRCECLGLRCDEEYKEEDWY